MRGCPQNPERHAEGDVSTHVHLVTETMVALPASQDLPALMAEADVRGRVCPDPQKLLDQIALFRENAIEAGCLSGPFEFPSDHGRFLFFRDPTRQPDSPAHEAFRCNVTVLSGLPAAGKDYWVEKNLAGWPIVTLDAIRQVQ